MDAKANHPSSTLALTEESFARALHELVEHDPLLAQVVEAHGPPPFWNRPPGFPTLVHIILEQQVSLASALAAYNRLLDALDPLTPQSLLTLDDAQLKTIGFSRQKTRYVRLLAQAILDSSLDLEGLTVMEDAQARHHLMAVKGIGPWTANIYLLMALRRTDIWPNGDLALVVAYRDLLGLPENPQANVLEETAAVWRPWRAVAARILWHFYLSTR